MDLIVTIGKRKRGRKPGKQAFEKQAVARANRHWLDCQECETESAEVDGDVVAFTCALCMCKQIPWPTAKQPPTAEEKQARAERKQARLERKEAIARGEAPPVKEDLGFGRGWHRRLLFTSEVDGEMRYYSKGKSVTKAQYTKIERAQAKQAKAKLAGQSGFGRGWHFKKNFIAPNGDVYNMGKRGKKASKTPTLDELNSLMEQHA